MFVIIESGSTKAEWAVVSDCGKTNSFVTEGINPSTQTTFTDLQNQTDVLSAIRACHFIYFYAAGIIDSESKLRLYHWLQGYGFTGEFFAASDMLAAARACFAEEFGIVGILGTGSNSCIYDGNEIIKTMPSLGYILSDEGGGTHIGKEVLRAYFYNLMPMAERQIFENNFSVSKKNVIASLYQAPNAGRYLASFTPFLSMVEGSWKKSLLKKVFRQFIELRIMTYPEYNRYPIKFVGSVAYNFQDILKETMSEFGLQASEIICHPVEKLIEYHLNKVN